MYTELKILLDHFNHTQKEYLSKELNNLGGTDSTAICNHLHYLRYGELGQFNPFNNRDYKQLVTDVADVIEIDWTTVLKFHTWNELKAEQIESAIVAKLFKNIWSELNEINKKEIINIIKDDDPELSKTLSSSGPINLDNLSKIQTYKLASTILASLSWGAGIKIPFKMYTVLSKVISISIGPIGWTALVANIFSQPKWDKLIRAILIITIFRNSPDQNY